MTSRPALRWLVPAGVLAVVLGGGAAFTAVQASAASGLPARSAVQLLADLRMARLDGATGTVVEHADLGLPTLPGNLGGDGSSDWQALLSGAHTLRVWYGGPGQTRIALIGSLGESDVIHNDRDVWVWSSDANTATHLRLPAAPAATAHALPSGVPSTLASATPLTPLDAANRIVAALTPTTSITSGSPVNVAGRAAYQLVIKPKDTASLIGSVRIAFDADRHIPLRVQIFAQGAAKPAFEIGFTEVDFATPDPDVFRFNPPPGAKVTQADPGSELPSPTTRSARPAVIGSGWTAIVAADAPLPAATRAGTLGTVLKALPTVHGRFGTGKVLPTALFSILVTDDGHVYLGSVSAARLVAAANAGS